MKTNSYLLYFVCTLISIGLISCKKDLEEIEIEGQTQALFTGNVEVPDGVSASNVTIISAGQETGVNENGDFQIRPDGIVYAINEANDEILYFGYYPASGFSSRNGSDHIQLNAEETALAYTFQYYILNFGLNPRDLGPDELVALKDWLKSNEKVKELKFIIQGSINEFGSIVEGLIKGTVEEVFNELGQCPYSVLTALQQPQNLQNAGLDEPDPTLFPNVEFGDYLNGLIRTEVEHGWFDTASNEWVLDVSIYNAMPTYLAATTGYYDTTLNDIVFSENDLTRVIQPYNSSSFFADFTSCQGLADFAQDTRNLFTGNFSGFVNSTSNYHHHQFEFRVPHNKDQKIVLFGPKLSENLQVLTIVQYLIKASALLSDLFDEATNTTLGENTAVISGAKSELLKEFSDRILSNSDLQGKVLTFMDKARNGELDKQLFNSLLLSIRDEWFDYIENEAADRLLQIAGLKGLPIKNAFEITKQTRVLKKILDGISLGIDGLQHLVAYRSDFFGVAYSIKMPDPVIFDYTSLGVGEGYVLTSWGILSVPDPGTWWGPSFDHITGRSFSVTVNQGIEWPCVRYGYSNSIFDPCNNCWYNGPFGPGGIIQCSSLSLKEKDDLSVTHTYQFVIPDSATSVFVTYGQCGSTNQAILQFSP